MAQAYVVGWNVWNEQSVKSVKANLSEIIDKVNPDVFSLCEASHLHGHLDNLGYQVIQLKSRRFRGVSNTANIALLVRADLQIKDRMTKRMKRFWRGPKAGMLQDPRVDRVVKVVIEGKTWKFRGSHGPFGAEARAEMVQSQRRFLRGRKPTVIIEDANMSQKEVRRRVAKPTNSKVAGHGIDMIVYRNCRLVKKENLGRHNSDHDAMSYLLEA